MPSLAAVVAASLSYNFFFLPPVYTLTIADPANIAAFLLFTLVAVVVSNLAGRSRRAAVIRPTSTGPSAPPRPTGSPARS